MERYGERPEYLSSKAVFLATMNRYEAAEAIYRNLIATDSSLFAYQIGLANVLSSQDKRYKKQEAYDIYKQIGAQPDQRIFKQRRPRNARKTDHGFPPYTTRIEALILIGEKDFKSFPDFVKGI